MARAMGEMTCMGDFRQATLSQGPVKALQPFSWAPWKVGPAQAVSELLC